MNIKQLETFLAIVQCGSFNAAADRLNATPSTISARIQELEQDLGVALFDRSQRRAHLTAKGRELQVYAERATSAFAEIKVRVGSGDALSGIVRLGVAELIAVTWLPAMVELIHNRYPKLTLELDVDLTVALAQRLDKGEIDLALIPGVHFGEHLTAKSLRRVRFAWMAGRSASLPDQLVEPHHLEHMRILSLGKDSYHHGTVEHWLNSDKDRPRSVDLCNSMGVIESLTRAGVGVSLLPVSCYAAEIAAGDLKVLKTQPEGPVVEFFAVYPKRPLTNIPSLIAELAEKASTFEM
jgi:DNA-binding transcriptional LysR family regulator